MDNVPRGPNSQQDEQAVAGGAVGLWPLAIGGIFGTAVWGIGYAAFQAHVGIFPFLGMLPPLFAGGFVAAGVVQAAKWSRLPRSRATVGSCIAWGVAAWYVQWVAWVGFVSRGEVVPALPWQLAAVLHTVAMEAPMDVHVGFAPICLAGGPRYVIWVLEAALWIGAAWGVGCAHWSIGQAALGILSPFLAMLGIEVGQDRRRSRWG